VNLYSGRSSVSKVKLVVREPVVVVNGNGATTARTTLDAPTMAAVARTNNLLDALANKNRHDKKKTYIMEFHVGDVVLVDLLRTRADSTTTGKMKIRDVLPVRKAAASSAVDGDSRVSLKEKRALRPRATVVSVVESCLT